MHGRGGGERQRQIDRDAAKEGEKDRDHGPLWCFIKGYKRLSFYGRDRRDRLSVDGIKGITRNPFCRRFGY